MELVTAPQTQTRIQGRVSDSPHPQQLLSTVWIMRIYDLAGSSYDAEKQIKSTLEGPLTQDTRADVLPTFSHVLPEFTWKAEGSPLPSPHLRLVVQECLILHASPQPRVFFFFVIVISLRNVPGVCAEVLPGVCTIPTYLPNVMC